MEQKIDWQAALDGSRPVTTRDGRKVTLYCVDVPGSWPVHGRIDGNGLAVSWSASGGHVDSAISLIQPPRRFKYERWVNVYKGGYNSGPFLTKELAAMEVSPARIACVKIIIEGEEGEGLE